LLALPDHIDARGWQPPSPAAVRAVVEATGLSQQEVGRRLGVGGRPVRSWVSERSPRAMRYSEAVALAALAREADA